MAHFLAAANTGGGNALDDASVAGVLAGNNHRL